MWGCFVVLLFVKALVVISFAVSQEAVASLAARNIDRAQVFCYLCFIIHGKSNKQPHRLTSIIGCYQWKKS